MKKLLQIIFIVGIFILVFQYRFELHQKLQPYVQNIGEKLHLVSVVNPCINPIQYNLGNFDTKFGISKEYFLSALSDAEAVWEKAQGDYTGKNMFDYNADATGSDVLKVNLVYDYRQQATSKLDSLGIVVKDTNASYESLKNKLENLKVDYENDKNSFNARVASFNQKQKQYEDDVSYWNSRGGAPQGEYDKLQSRKIALENESSNIENLKNSLNAKVDEINALVVAVNRLIGTLNLQVDKYNTTNESRGESFEEGVYITDGNKSEIDIYEFSNREKLVRVLAHELGHALGLDHVEDKNAIMYRLNQGDNLNLTKTDIEAIKTKCGNL